MHASHHQEGRFMVPRREDCPEVGEVRAPYLEPLEDEIAELASGHCRLFVERTTNLAALVTFGRALVAMIEQRQAANVDDFEHVAPVRYDAAPPEEQRPVAELDLEGKRRLVAAELGSILDWVCQGRAVPEMGVRIAAVASHVRSKAIDHRTDQQLAREVGNDSRESIRKVRKNFRLSFGADYPGEHGKGSNTRTRCKNSRLKNLKN